MGAASRAKLLGSNCTTYCVALGKFLNFICEMKITVTTSQGCCKAQSLAHIKKCSMLASLERYYFFLRRSILRFIRYQRGKFNPNTCLQNLNTFHHTLSSIADRIECPFRLYITTNSHKFMHLMIDKNFQRQPSRFVHFQTVFLLHFTYTFGTRFCRTHTMVQHLVSHLWFMVLCGSVWC